MVKIRVETEIKPLLVQTLQDVREKTAYEPNHIDDSALKNAWESFLPLKHLSLVLTLIRVRKKVIGFSVCSSGHLPKKKKRPVHIQTWRGHPSESGMLSIKQDQLASYTIAPSPLITLLLAGFFLVRN